MSLSLSSPSPEEADDDDETLEIQIAAQSRGLLGAMEDNVGIPEDLRCKRSDGKQWRCSALSMPDKTVCEKHYHQAKRRAANSAIRASLKKAKRKSMDDTDVYLESKYEEPDLSRRALSPFGAGGGGGGGGRYRQKAAAKSRHPGSYSPVRGSLARGGLDVVRVEESRVRGSYGVPLSKELGRGRYGEYSGKSSDSLGEAEGLTCHQCRRNDRAIVVWCSTCDRKGYCDGCISRWYVEIPMEDIRRICPACRGICNCKACLRGDNLIKAKVQEIAAVDKLQYLHNLLAFVLPVLKQIYSEQCFEIGLETRISGMKVEIPRAKLHEDEQMCCDICRIPILDYHRHCTYCMFDLCLTCCRDLRRASSVAVKGEPAVEKSNSDKLTSDECALDLSCLFPTWKANTDGSIPCGSREAGGCGSSKLVLRRILKINWVAKLIKNAEEMVNGCKVSDLQGIENCASCTGSTTSQLSGPHGVDNRDKFMYCPVSEDVKHNGISHFHKHWVRGEPVIVKEVFDHSLASSWDPMSIWRGIQETEDERMKEDNVIVKALDYINQSEVEIALSQFIKGYYEGCKREDGWPQMLKLKDWPPPSALEEFILCQRPEFLSNLPLVEFIHSKWGLLNLAAKLPHNILQTEEGPKLIISYGSPEELGRGDPLSNLQINMDDLVYLLMHASEVNIHGCQSSKIENIDKFVKESDRIDSAGNTRDPNIILDERERPPDMSLNGCASGLKFTEDDIMEDKVCSGTERASLEMKALNSSHIDKTHIGAIWDVYRRQDVPKLDEFLIVHWKELTNSNSQTINLVKHPVYEQSFHLSRYHKRKLKEEFGIEPWTFVQHVGEAVFIPAGCPFQLRNLQSTVQLGLHFLSPESLGESCRMAQEIRCLPNDHDAKLKMLEAGKMSLYAASSAIREIQKITLDPKLCSDIKFEDRNLTALVFENLERITKRKQIVCT